MFFRNRRLVRAVACYLLLQTLGTVVGPVVALAGNGPMQPEFTSYNPGGSELVNLVTGDFAYTLPLLEVPGPERSFAIPLSYKSGIKLEQEASWVGLGWTLNAGAVARTPNGTPDDAAGDKVQTRFVKHVAAVKKVDYIPGVWTSVTDIYTGKTVGKVDVIGLVGLNYDNEGIAGGDVIGLGYQKGEGGTFDPVRLGFGLMTIASLGATGAAAAAGGAAAAIGTSVGTQLGMQVAVGVAASAFGLGKLSGAPGIGNQFHVYEYSTGMIPIPGLPISLGPNTEYRYSLYGNLTDESGYGSLYFGKMSQQTAPIPANMPVPGIPIVHVRNRIRLTTNTGTAIAPVEFINSRSRVALQDPTPGLHQQEISADVYQPAGTSSYPNAKPLSIAHDYFSVMGEGASGLIRPFRMDVGSVVSASLQSHGTFLENKYMAVPFQDYKIGFRYEGELSNTYEYHQNSNPADIGFAVSADKRSITVTDQRLFEATMRTAPTRPGIVNGASGPRLVQGKNVQWFSNQEIEQMGSNAAASEFLDFAPPVATAATANVFRQQRPPSGIGAFRITTEDGTTYHYSLPVYEYKTNTYSNETPAVAGKLMYGLPGTYHKKEGISSTGNPHGGYATTWLLTAVTSSDYIDRNSSGTVDAQDWGGWVKLEYGKFSSQYKWRQPYIGNSYSDEITKIIDYVSSREGYRESYYLDRISTRTHTALFVKSRRVDGKGHFANASASQSGLGINEQLPASSLRLDEIVLLDNVALDRLQTPDGIGGAGSATPVPALSNNTASNAMASACACGDDLAGVLDGGDLTADTRIKQFVEVNALKRVHFNYSYDLCQGTPNSFSYTLGQANSLPPMSEAQAGVNRSGKLTLESVSFFGPTIGGTPTKLVPDFLFGYDAPGFAAADTNPRYQKDKWDAFGMYKAEGAFSVVSHMPTPQAYAAPWTLTRVTDPLGGVTRVAYERDQYAHVSESDNTSLNFQTNNVGDSNGNIVLTLSTAELAKINDRLGDVVHVGDALSWNASINYRCAVTTGDATFSTLRRADFTEPRTVLELRGNNQVVVGGFYNTPCDGQVFMRSSNVYLGLPFNRLGGDVRVANITASEPASGANYEVRYKYTSTAQPVTGNSTGVIAQALPFDLKDGGPSEDQYDYPQTPVLYSQVSVLRGLFRNNNDREYTQREVFEFHTPASTMITEELRPAQGISDYLNEATGEYNGSVVFNNDRVRIGTGLIGRPKAVRVYNQQGHLELSTAFQYSNQVANADNIAKQGCYTEGLLSNHLLNNTAYHVNRTTKVYEPAVLIGTTTVRNGVASQGRNVLFDFFTGQTLETSQTNSRGQTYHTRIIPAYTLPGQAAMGPKGANAANRNMLVQPGASYSFVETTGGPTYNPLNFLNPQTSHVLAASVQTWQSNWANYREADTNGDYQNVAGATPVWRQAAAYTWQSSLLAPDGSFSGFVPFLWIGASDARWLKAGETVRYDHYSHPLEGRDVNGLYSANKTGHAHSQTLATAANARYTEIAYSGAEDGPTLINGAKHFGGEVVTDGERVAATTNTPPPHTGQYSVQLAGDKRLFYRATAGTEVVAGKPYRLSVWVHRGEAAKAGLYASLGNGTLLGQATTASPDAKKAGDWYRLSLTVAIPATAAGQTVEFGCRNTDGAAGSLVYADDFRISPLTASMSSLVMDPRTNRTTETLDNENLYTRYQYNATGRLGRVYQETFDRPGSSAAAARLVKEFEYHYARNASYTVSVTSTGAPAGSAVSPASPVTVLVGDDANFTLPSVPCPYVLNQAFVVDGVVRTGNCTLLDNTRIVVNGTQVSVQNVRGPHNIAFSHQMVTYPQYGEELSRNCQIDDATGCKTGFVLRSLADGCGGSYPDPDNPIVATSADNCAPGPGCLNLNKSTKSSKKPLKISSSRLKQSLNTNK